jgi:hypothetical protein
MAKTPQFTLNEVARALRMHPRSLCRVLTGTDATGWAASRWGTANLSRIAKAFGTYKPTLLRILNGEIRLATITEICRELNMSYLQCGLAIDRGLLKPILRREGQQRIVQLFAVDHVAQVATSGVLPRKRQRGSNALGAALTQAGVPL